MGKENVEQHCEQPRPHAPAAGRAQTNRVVLGWLPTHIAKLKDALGNVVQEARERTGRTQLPLPVGLELPSFFLSAGFWKTREASWRFISFSVNGVLLTFSAG